MSTFLHSLQIDPQGRHTDPAFAESWRAVAAAAQASLASPIQGGDVTDRPSGWGHNYFCPDHGDALEFIETQPDRHRCAAFDHHLTGPQYDSGWAYVRNLRLQEHLTASAVSACVTGSPADTDRAVRLLTELARVYPDLPLHGEKVGQAKLMHQSLEEAVAATSLARSYAMVEPSMTREQQDLLADSLFRPLAGVIEDHLMHRVHNIEVWHLAGLASLAVVLGDRELAVQTLEREHGIRVQLADGLRADGWWYEGSPGYHFYMLTAVLAAAESYRALDIDSHLTDMLERMLLAPVRTVRNDLTMPSFNDSSTATAQPPGLAIYSDLYVRGAAVCRSDQLDAFLASPLTASFDRSSIDHLVYGRPTTGPAPAAPGWPVPRDQVWPDSGWTALRRPDAEGGDTPDTCVFLKFGPHGGGHGHPDKLEIDLMIDGNRVIADPGAAKYTNPIHVPWYGRTWSHSTVLIDRISQPPIKGTLLGHRPVGVDAVGYIDAHVSFADDPDPEGTGVLWHIDDPAPVAAYAGVTIRRLLAMAPPAMGDYLLDLVLVAAPRRCSIDLITHVRGAFDQRSGRPAGARLLLPEFRDVRWSPEPAGRVDYRLTDDGRPWARQFAGGDELLTAVTPSNPPHESCATTVERVVDRQARFVALYPLGAHEPAGLRVADDGRIEVELTGASHHWHCDEMLRADPQPLCWQEPPLRLEVLYH